MVAVGAEEIFGGAARFVLDGFRRSEIGEARIWIEADDAHGVGDEIRERVDVIVELPAGAVVDHIFEARRLLRCRGP